MNKDQKTTRVNIIDAVKTPLGFFTLVSLIVETGLGIMTIKLSGEAQLVALYGMIGTLIILIIVVALIGIYKPEALIVSNSDFSFLQTRNETNILQQLGKGISEKTILYYFNYYKREDELLLDGTQITTINIHMVAQSDMSGWKDSITSDSEDLFPFSYFDIKLGPHSREPQDSVKIQVLKRTDSKNSWELIIDPPLRKGEFLSFTFKINCRGHRVMCVEDLLDVARHKKSPGSVMVHTWKNIYVNTEQFHWIFKFPEGYEISSAQPYVAKSEKRLKQQEALLENGNLFTRTKDLQGRWNLRLQLKYPTIFYSYGFAWIPPSSSNYDLLCQKNNIIPLHYKKEDIIKS